MAAAGVLAVGCGGLLPQPSPPPAFFTLDAAVYASVPAQPLRQSRPTLIVHATQAAAGFDSARMLYTRKAHQLEAYTQSEWVDTPARMLAPWIVSAASSSAAFRAVVMAPSAAASDLRLETELLRLQHEFGETPSRVRLVLRATLTDSATRHVLARREFDVLADAPSEDAYGGVIAANHAAQSLMQALAAFCADGARPWQPGGAALVEPP
jgi:cholesterol transport system auxiliary component